MSECECRECSFSTEGSSEAVLRFDVDSGDELGEQTALPATRIPDHQLSDGTARTRRARHRCKERSCFLGPADEGLTATIASISADGGTVRLTA
jgi:hypothetical protein